MGSSRIGRTNAGRRKKLERSRGGGETFQSPGKEWPWGYWWTGWWEHKPPEPSRPNKVELVTEWGWFSLHSSSVSGLQAVLCAGQHAGLRNADGRRKSWWSPRRERRFRGQRPGKQEHQGWSVERGPGNLDLRPSMVSRLVATSPETRKCPQGWSYSPNTTWNLFIS